MFLSPNHEEQSMKEEFVDKVVWITGGGSGLGEVLAVEMARRGAYVVVSGRRQDKLDAVVTRVERGGGRAIAIPCDVTDDSAVQAVVKTIIAQCGHLDVAVANAGVGVSGPFEKLTDAEWRRQFDINVIGLVSTARHTLPELRKSRGRLVLIASVVSFMVGRNTAPYCSSKWAVRAIGIALAQELHGSGVTCTTIYPGFVESEITYVDNAGVFRPDRHDPRPKRLMWSGERAAKVMANAIAKRKEHFVFTGHGKIAAWLGQHFPRLLSWGIKRFG
jgi:NAD(P)-dependent dehydrogenase (short-subunit alcohol dehydrogenase family)